MEGGEGIPRPLLLVFCANHLGGGGIGPHPRRGWGSLQAPKISRCGSPSVLGNLWPRGWMWMEKGGGDQA